MVRTLESHKRGLRFVLRIFIIFLIIAGFWFDWSLWKITEASTSYNLPDQPADAILVLGCPPEIPGEPSNCELDRAAAAIELWNAGYSRVLIFTGGDTGKGIEALYMAAIAQAEGIPQEQILTEEHSKNTVENLKLSGEVLKSRGRQSVILVSEPYHLYRAREIAGDQGIEVAGWWPAVKARSWQDSWSRSLNLIKDSLSPSVMR